MLKKENFRKERKMKKQTITGLVLVTVLMITGIAVAQPGGGMGNRQMGGQGESGHGERNFFQNIRPMMHILELTDQQREAVAEIIEEAKTEIESLHSAEEAGSHREEFIDLFSSASLTVAQMENLMNSRIENMRTVNSIVSRALVDIHDLLTDEQLAKLAAFDPSTMERGEGGHGGGANRGNGDRMNMGVHPNR